MSNPNEETYDVSDRQLDDVVSMTVRKLGECGECSFQNTDFEEVEYGTLDGAFAVRVVYHCVNCGSLRAPIATLD